ncbi:MAG: hypothetical protein JWQ11_4171 [Rhizobacter sp.]|nr:hypothetical protein [Rhizobacter sp.]
MAKNSAPEASTPDNTKEQLAGSQEDRAQVKPTRHIPAQETQK